MSLKQTDIQELYNEFQLENNQTDRYRSYDYCYNYFHPKSGNPFSGDIEKSCLAIGFYLSSWGMLRGSAHLLTKSAKCYEPLIDYIAHCEESYWNLDVCDYDDPKEKKQILALYDGIYAVLNDKVFYPNKQMQPDFKQKQRNPSRTLVTKIMLGVFGVVPAFDDYFTTAIKILSENKCRFSSFSETLGLIHQFYLVNKSEIDALSDSTETIDFRFGNPTGLKYTKAKIIDMYGFIKGEKIGRATKSELAERKRVANKPV